MKIRAISISIFELPANTGRFQMEQTGRGVRKRWTKRVRVSRQSRYTFCM